MLALKKPCIIAFIPSKLQNKTLNKNVKNKKAYEIYVCFAVWNKCDVCKLLIFVENF